MATDREEPDRLALREEPDHIGLQIEIWKQVIDVQKHFNDLCLRVRNVGISLLGVLLAAGAALHANNVVIHFASRDVSVAFWFLVVGLIVWLAMYVMDRQWYHVLLRASVEHGISIERRLMDTFPDIGLATHVQRRNHEGHLGTGARKLTVFYGAVTFILLVTMVLLLLASKPTASSTRDEEVPGKAPTEQAIEKR